MERLRKIGFAKLTSVVEAQEKLFSSLKPLNSEKVEIRESLNRIIAEDIYSEINIPPFDRAAMDGYAIRAENSFGASPKNPKHLALTGMIEIGEYKELKLDKGQAIRISTGAAIPKGADSVIKIEDTELEDEKLTLYTALTPGQNVSRSGEDILKGKHVLKKGTELKAEHIALLASLGIKIIPVMKKPRVMVHATGNELIEVGEKLGPNTIYNSNSLMIANLVRLYGGEVVGESSLKDNKELIKKALLDAVKISDLVIFTGGTSVGTRDFLPEVIQETGSILTHGVAMRPGSPILMALVENTLVFCLPGTPVAAYAGFLKFAGPAIRKMMSSVNADPRIEIKAVMNNDVPVSKMGFVNLLRVELQILDDKIIAIPVKLKGSGVISSLTDSDGIVEIPPSQEGLKKGDLVPIKLHPK